MRIQSVSAFFVSLNIRTIPTIREVSSADEKNSCLNTCQLFPSIQLHFTPSRSTSGILRLLFQPSIVQVILNSCDDETHSTACPPISNSATDHVSGYLCNDRPTLSTRVALPTASRSMTCADVRVRLENESATMLLPLRCLSAVPCFIVPV